MASSAKTMIDHGTLEMLLDLPEGVWIASVSRIPATSGQGWGFEFDLRSTEDDAFPADRVDLLYTTTEEGSVTLTGMLTPEEVAAAS